MAGETWQLPAVFESEQGPLRYAVFGAGPSLVLVHLLLEETPEIVSRKLQEFFATG
jgi:hypothetical protein